MSHRSYPTNVKHHPWHADDLLLWILRILLVCCAWLILASIAEAQTAASTRVATQAPTGQNGPSTAPAASRSSNAEAHRRDSLQIHSVPKINLGHFEMQNLEPTRALTAKIAFQLHVTLPENTSAADLAELERWQHRLREQVIVAVRVSEIVDFLDPTLERFRRHILYRINRLIRPVKAQDVLLADFTFSAS